MECSEFRAFFWAFSQSPNSWKSLPQLCKNIAGGRTQNVISILFAKIQIGFRGARSLVSLTSHGSYNFVHNFLLISVTDWYSCLLILLWSDDIVCWSKFPNFDMWVGCQKLSAMLNLRLIIFLSKPIVFVLKIPLMAKSLLWNSLPEKYIKLRLLLKWSWKW